jgi:hypothetical protein
VSNLNLNEKFSVKPKALYTLSVYSFLEVVNVKATYRFVTNKLQDKLGVVEAEVRVELTPQLIRELAQRGVKFNIGSLKEGERELQISTNYSYEYDDMIREEIRKAAIEKIMREVKDSNAIVADFEVKLDVNDIDLQTIDNAYRKELEDRKEHERRKNMLAEIKRILKDLQGQKIVVDFRDMNDYIKARFIDDSELSCGLYDNLENIIQSLKALNKEQILIRVIEKLKRKIEELEKEKEKLRERVLEEIANTGSFTIKKEREITYVVTEEDC